MLKKWTYHHVAAFPITRSTVKDPLLRWKELTLRAGHLDFQTLDDATCTSPADEVRIREAIAGHEDVGVWISWRIHRESIWGIVCRIRRIFALHARSQMSSMTHFSLHTVALKGFQGKRGLAVQLLCMVAEHRCVWGG